LSANTFLALTSIFLSDSNPAHMAASNKGQLQERQRLLSLCAFYAQSDSPAQYNRLGLDNLFQDFFNQEKHYLFIRCTAQLSSSKLSGAVHCAN
jgi:hypothetical protein